MKDHRKERAEARKKAEKLVSQMTILEKASQLKYDAAPVKRLGVPAYNYWNEALHGVVHNPAFIRKHIKKSRASGTNSIYPFF